ncbi:sulfite exporter TauE/SafE family protein [Hymenobacter persicinus]|uniref:Sulfite exporter TauE/SafE family protein n=1 Tax=Hymenobacter persicinus TaxID=2025506 RepID=A0A4V1ZAZ6_9BACT|nr:sulfite exporter TauE/SafE family protein [Hymenobacter persicinus]RYU81530.1 sulfite exporter TauE/SafE family protein [Hymenobacter persicinus]
MLWAGFVFGLLGSFHCVGMCGAIALALPGRAEAGSGSASARYLSGRLLYNLGRITTYAALGATAGLLGHGLRLAGLQQSLSIASGLLILLLLGLPPRVADHLSSALGVDRPLAWVKNALVRLFQQYSWRALYLAGVLNGLLPCGLVYLALAGALSAPGVGGAAAYMASFGLGTLPLMLGLSLTGRLVPLVWRLRLRQTVPYAASVLAVLLIVRGLGLGIPYLSPQLNAPAAQRSSSAGLPRSMHYCR